MKVQLKSGFEYTGYKHVDLDQFKELADNSCEEILAFGWIQKYKLAEVAPFFSLLISKLRKNGKLSFNFINYQTLKVYDLDIEQFNAIMEGESYLNIKEARKLCENHGLKVLTFETDTNTTTMVATRA